MELEKIFDGLNIEQMARESIEGAAAEYDRRPEVKAENAYINWLENLAESMNRTARETCRRGARNSKR